MTRRLEMWKAHRESSEKFNYYITALSVTVLVYFLGREEEIYKLELWALYSLSVSILMSLYVIRQNILVLHSNYEVATKAEQGVGDSDSRNKELEARFDKIMKRIGVVQPLRSIFLLISLLLLLISRSI